MKKELKIFIFVFITLSLMIHYEEFFTHPIEHIVGLESSGAYGFGIFHPLVFSTIVYIVIGIPRILFKIIKRKVV